MKNRIPVSLEITQFYSVIMPFISKNYYRCQPSQEQLHTVLQTHVKGSSLRGISRISRLAYGAVVSIVRAAIHKAQMVHNALVQHVETKAVIADELWSFVKKQQHCLPDELIDKIHNVN